MWAYCTPTKMMSLHYFPHLILGVNIRRRTIIWTSSEKNFQNEDQREWNIQNGSLFGVRVKSKYLRVRN